MRLAILASTLTIVSSRRTSASGYAWLHLLSQGESAQTEHASATAERQLPGTTPTPVTTGVAEEYECASEVMDGSGDCPQCTLSRRCTCEGAVRFGYEPHWTDWHLVKGDVDCSVHVFGDPYPGHGKICMCRPRFSDCDGVPFLGNHAVEEKDTWALACILAVALTFFGFHVTLALVRLYNQVSSLYPGTLEKVLEASMMSVQMAPMLCVVFIVVLHCAVTMQGETAGMFLLRKNLEGEQEATRGSGCVTQPIVPDHLRIAVAVCAVTFCLQAVLRLNLEWVVVTEPINTRMIMSNQVRFVRLSENVFNVTWMLMFLALAAVLILVVVQQPMSTPKFLGGKTNFGLATCCTVFLAVVYFVVYVGLFALKIGAYRLQPARYISFGIATMKLGTIAVNFAPMLGILFLGIQFALDWRTVSDHDALPESPPDYVIAWMLVCTGSILSQVLLVIFVPMIFGAKLQRDGHWGQEALVMKDQEGFISTCILRWLAMVFIFCGVYVVCYEMWALRGVVPPVAHLVCFLAGLYFTMYCLLWVVNSARLVFGLELCTATMLCIVAKETVVLCPMLAAVFLGSWACAAVRGVGGATWRTPQGYGQGYMYVVVFVLLLQLVLVLLLQAKEGPTLHPGLQRGGLAPEELYTAPTRRYEGRPRISAASVEVPSPYELGDPSVSFFLRAATGVMS